ncbi:hypothetical protein EZS27_017343 [termite gut metagenome]|uniref:KilA-N DNA-binding domain-containing protein n=1 Tax=termite gut metagenome TaxID=433724 RepID=A0A5J4RMK5_9ZZZZ
MNELISIEQKIHEIRGQRVMLDFDLAEMYQTETRLLKRAVRRNPERFPEDFMFELTKQEWKELVPIWDNLSENSEEDLISQIGISSWGGTRHMPFAFTEQGVAMLSSVLHSEIAIKVNISIMRAFVAVRNYLANHVSSSKEVEELKKEMKLLNSNMPEMREDIDSLNKDVENHDEQMEDLFQAFAKLSAQIQSKTALLERI